jgi:bifunctional non-homologous end joining protein LigD
MTGDGVMRHPSFVGMRNDKNAKKVILEEEQAVNEIIGEQSKGRWDAKE